MKLLEKKIFVTKTNNWYAPTCEFHEKHKSIERMVLMDTTSSAGDWSGFLIQRTGKNCCVAIPFYQENRYPGDGFILYTGTAFMRGTYEIDFVNTARKEWAERATNGFFCY